MVPSHDSAGPPSSYCVLIVGPRFMGVDQTSRVVSRVATHRSMRPNLPERSDVMNISRPSFRMAVRVSRRGLLSSGTILARPNVPFSRCVLTYDDVRMAPEQPLLHRYDRLLGVSRRPRGLLRETHGSADDQPACGRLPRSAAQPRDPRARQSKAQAPLPACLRPPRPAQSRSAASGGETGVPEPLAYSRSRPVRQRSRR